MRVQTRHDREHLLCCVGVVTPVVVKVSQHDIVLQAVRDLLQLRRRCEAAADGGVKMRVVPVESNVCDHCERERSADNGGSRDARARGAQMQRQAQC
jgi:hypothetical protein